MNKHERALRRQRQQVENKVNYIFNKRKETKKHREEELDASLAAIENIKFKTDTVYKQRKRKMVATTVALVSLILCACIIVPASIYYVTAPVTLTMNSTIVGNSYNIKVKKGTKISEVVAAEIEGYDFIGFYKDANFTNEYAQTDIIKKNTNVFLKYEIKTFNVTIPTSSKYTLQQSSKVVEYGGNCTFSIYSKNNYDVSNIVVKANGQLLTPRGSVYTINDVKSDIVVTITGVARAKRILTLNCYGEIFSSNEYEIEYGKSIAQAFEEIETEYNEYNSCGWYLDEDCTQPVNKYSVITESIALYTKPATLNKLTFNWSGSLYTVGAKNTNITGEVVLPVMYTDGTNSARIATLSSTAFNGCSKISAVYMNEVTFNVNGDSFKDCTNLKKVVINPNNKMTYIPFAGFKNCKNLTFINLPDSITEIRGHAFYGCEKLQFINLPNKLTILGIGCFANCKKLVSVDMLSTKIENIEDGAFENCEALNSVNLSNNLTTIGNRVFYGCISLNELYIPKSVISIKRHNFEECSNLQISLEDSTKWQYEKSSGVWANIVPNAVATQIKNGDYNMRKIN